MWLPGPFKSPAFLLVPFLIFFHVKPAAAQTIYVGPNEAYDNIGWGIAVANEGDTIIVRDGVYTQNIKVRKAVVLMAENRHQAILTGNDSIQARISIRQASVDGAVIDGFRFTSGDYAAINVGDMDPGNFPENCVIRNNRIEGRRSGIIVSPHAMNTTITGNLIMGCQGTAISDVGKGNVKISDNTLEDNGSGIFLAEQHDVVTSISGNTIRNNTGGPGIEIEKNQVTVEGNLIEGNLVGIGTNCGREGLIVRDNNQVINNIEQGIVMDCGNEGIVQDNIISGNGHEGIRIGGNVTVKGNYIHHNSGFGLWVTDGTGNVQDNSIFSNGIHGIEVSAEAQSLTITQNNIYDNMECGILLWNGASIKGNTITGNLQHGILLAGQADSVKITDQNLISKNMGCEIYLEEETSALIRGNTIEDDTTDLDERMCHSGILIKGSARVEGNLIRGTNSAAINITETATEVIVSGGNTIDSCQYGVVARTHAIIVDNTISNTAAIGIYVTATGNESSISYNEIRKNRYGIYYEEGSPDLAIRQNNINENVFGIYAGGEASVRSNTIQWNDSTGITIQQGGIDLGTALEADSGKNSILENGVWNILNESSDTVNALYNFWGITDKDSIDATIFDDDEDDLSGPVLFDPFLLDSVPVDPYVDTLNLAIRENNFPAEDPDPGRILNIFPNPADGRVTICFTLKEKQQVSLKVYDTSGRQASAVITNRYYPAGIHRVTWDFITAEGKGIPGGLYFLVLTSENVTDVCRLVRLH